jgi:ATP:corrinoid adenosyltransferase
MQVLPDLTRGLVHVGVVVFMKGQSKTGLYRFLTKKGGYVWMETHATIVGEAMSDHLKYILCVNYVVRYVRVINLVNFS